MRKLLLGVAMLLLAQMGFGQAVQDNATIPVSVTLNAILRLTVTSGGNIQFVFNTMDQYENGIGNTAGTTTTFNVAASRDYTVSLQAEETTGLQGVDLGGALPLNVLQYEMISDLAANLVIAGVQPLTAAQVDVVTDGQAGSAAANVFHVQWAAGTVTSILALDPQPVADVYVTNVFLNLQTQ